MGFAEQQRLGWDELEVCISQSVFNYASDFPQGADPLQLFDFLELLKRVGSRAFIAEPLSALNLTLGVLEDRLRVHTISHIDASQVELLEEASAMTEQPFEEEEEEEED